MEDDAHSRVAPVGADDSVFQLEELPESHLFRLVHRNYDDRTPVDWSAVSERLETQEGALEASQWVTTEDRGRQLFLHFLCRLCVTNEVAIQAVKAYPDALRFPDGVGKYPLHILCQDFRFHLCWSFSGMDTAKELFKTVLNGNPEAAELQVGEDFDNRTPLHCLAASLVSPPDPVSMLLKVFPNAARIKDRNEALPLHCACSGGNLQVVEMLYDEYPMAVELLSRSRSCLQASLCFCILPIDYAVVRFLIEACPRMLAHDDGQQSRPGERRYPTPVGDSLDYICQNYCESLLMSNDPELPDAQYFRRNVAFVDGTQQGQVGDVREDFVAATFDMVVTILRQMYGSVANGNSVLHAAVHGSLCRPWNLVVFKEVVSRFGHEAQEMDSNGDLPLHLFLKSCMIERGRSIERRFVADGEEYEEAVARSLRILLGAHSDAAATPNGDGRFPLHLALDHHSLSYQTAVEPLLDVSPRLLLTRDSKTGLYPFMTAAAGANANVDRTYRLLRRDPMVLQS